MLYFFFLRQNVKFTINIAVVSFKAHARNFTVSHGIPILSVGNSVASVEGFFHQTLVLRATKYRVYTMTDLSRQSLVTSCLFLWVL